MPRDVAVEWPHPRVIRLVLQDDVTGVAGAASLHELRVAALGVLLMRDGAVPGARAFGQNVEVVAVKVHGVGGDHFVFHDQADGGVGAEVVDVPLWVGGIGGVTLVGEEEERVIVIGTEGYAVGVEKVVICSVGSEGDDHVLRDSRVGRSGEGKVRSGGGKGVVGTFAIIVRGGRGGGGFGGVGLLIVDGGESVGLFGQITGGAEIGTHPDGGIRRAGGGDEDVGSLAHPKSDDVGGVGNNGDEVVGNDGHVQAVDCETLETFGASVDKS